MKKRNVGTGIALVVGMLVGGAWWIWCPIIKKFPNPTGRYGVGYRMEYTQEARSIDTWIRDLSTHAQENRSLSLHIWHPAECLSDCSVVPYAEQKMPLLQKVTCLPKLSRCAQPWHRL